MYAVPREPSLVRHIFVPPSSKSKYLFNLRSSRPSIFQHGNYFIVILFPPFKIGEFPFAKLLCDSSYIEFQ